MNTHYIRPTEEKTTSPKLDIVAHIIYQSTSDSSLMDIDAIFNAVKCYFYSSELPLPTLTEVCFSVKELIKSNLLKEISGNNISYSETKNKYTYSPGMHGFKSKDFVWAAKNQVFYAPNIPLTTTDVVLKDYASDSYASTAVPDYIHNNSEQLIKYYEDIKKEVGNIKKEIYEECTPDIPEVNLTVTSEAINPKKTQGISTQSASGHQIEIKDHTNGYGRVKGNLKYYY